METTRQQKVARLLQKELAGYFQRNAAKFSGKMISVTVVRVSPDFSFAKAFVSIFPGGDSETVLELIRDNAREIRHELAQLMRYQLRRMPDLGFDIDDSLDYAERIDELLDK